MIREIKAPETYQQWLDFFEELSYRKVSEEYINSLRMGECPGIETVINQFLNRIQKTVNNVLNRSTKRCNKVLNELLEDNDLSNMEAILCRSYKEIAQSRFYLNIKFLPQKFVEELDRQTVEEINRYWSGIKEVFVEATEETGDSCLYDMVYYVNKLISKDKRHYGKL